MGNQPLSRSRRGVVVALMFAAAILLAVGAVGAMRAPAVPTAGPTDMTGRPVRLDPGDTPSAPMRKRMHAVADTGSRLTVESVGLNVPLGALDEVDGQITPPGFTSAYVVRNLGVPIARASTGSVFVVMHSLRDGAVGPGNYLIDVAAGTSRVHAGARVQVGRATYVVTGWRAIQKTDVPTDPALWSNVPGRLVIFTCLQVPAQTESVANMVITARLVHDGA